MDRIHLTHDTPTADKEGKKFSDISTVEIKIACHDVVFFFSLLIKTFLVIVNFVCVHWCYN